MGIKSQIEAVLAALIISGLSQFATYTPSSALTYSQDIGVNFTFNSTIRITLSSNDLKIPNLSPGTSADSNIIDVNIATNNVNGYTLNATVGNNTTTYNTRDLVHTNNNITNKFSSIDYGSNVSSLTNLTDNTWAYSYSLDNGTTWIANVSNSGSGSSGSGRDRKSVV